VAAFYGARLQAALDSAEARQVEAEEQRGEAEKQRLLARRYLYSADMNVAHRAWQEGNAGYVLELLRRHQPAGDADLRGFEWHYLWRLAHSPLLNVEQREPVAEVAFSPDGRLLASTGDGGTVLLRDPLTGALVRTLGGGAPVVSFAFSPNGRFLAGASGRVVHLWDVSTGDLVLTYGQHEVSVGCVAFSPDGELLASGDAGGSVHLWARKKGTTLHRLEEHTRTVTQVAFRPDGAVLASAGLDRVIFLWNVREGKREGTLHGHTDTVSALCYAPDGKLLASGGWDQTIRLWGLATDAPADKPAVVLAGHAGPVSALAFAPAGATLASASWDRTVRVWDVARGQEVAVYRGHSGWVNSVAYHPRLAVLASGGKEGAVKLWDASLPQSSLALLPHGRALTALAFSPDGDWLASGCQDGTWKLWATDASGQPFSLERAQAAKPQAEEGLVRRLRLSGDDLPGPERLIPADRGPPSAGGAWLFSRAAPYRPRPPAFRPPVRPPPRTAPPHRPPLPSWRSDVPWRASAKAPAGKRKQPGPEGCFVGFDGQGRLLAVTVASAAKGQFWSPAEGRSVTAPFALEGAFYAVALSRDGRRIAGAGADGAVRVFDDSGRLLRKLSGHTGAATALAFGPGGLLASGGADRVVRIWEAESGRVVRELKHHEAGITGLAWHDGAGGLASASLDGTVRLWDGTGGAVRAVLQGHADAVNGLAFSPNGSRLATAGADRTVRLWDTTAGQEVLCLKGHTEGVTCVAFSADGKRLASGSQAGEVRVWDTAGRGPLAEALRQGHAFAELGRWAEAADAFARATGRRTDGPRYYEGLARLAGGDRAGWKRLADQALRAAGAAAAGSEDVRVAVGLAVLEPGADAAALLPLLEKLSRKKEPLLVGAALFRLGRAKEAVALLEEGGGGENDLAPTAGALFLALARHALGEKEEAGEALRSAEREIRDEQRASGAVPWVSRLTHERLLGEARRAVRP
jgi:WD40 repeat protein